MNPVPETSNRADWPRLVARAVNSLLNRAKTLEGATAYTVATVTFTPSTTPTSPVAGMTYFDSGTLKLRTYDGTVWNDHW